MISFVTFSLFDQTQHSNKGKNAQLFGKPSIGRLQFNFLQYENFATYRDLYGVSFLIMACTLLKGDGFQWNVYRNPRRKFHVVVILEKACSVVS